MSPHPVLGRVWGVRPGSSSACSPGQAGVWLAVCPLARVPERKEPARLLLFWVVVPTALPYIWHVEAITAESCGAARLPPGAAPTLSGASALLLFKAGFQRQPTENRSASVRRGSGPAAATGRGCVCHLPSGNCRGPRVCLHCRQGHA